MTTPNTNIKILKNVPLNNEYINTINFSTKLAQQEYFTSLKKYEFTYQSYVRMFKGVIRIEKGTEDLYDCNYLMLQNTAYGTKWFYAFITELEYKSDKVTFIHFELDVMQTWWFDVTIKQCFVEREHVVDDSVGLNTVPEDFQLGEYITTSSKNLLNEDLTIVVLATEYIPDPIIEGGALPRYIFNEPAIVGDFPLPLYWTYFTGITDNNMYKIGAIIDTYSREGKNDAIVAIFTMPSTFSGLSEVKEQYLEIAPAVTSIPVKNNKLLTYPYTCCSVVAGGQGLILKYELFNSETTQRLLIRGGFGPNMKVSATPRGYRGMSNDVENTITLSGFPLIPFVQDYYQNWVAQNQASMAVGIIGAGAVAIGASAVIATTAVPAIATAGWIAGAGSKLAVVGGGVMSMLSSVAKIMEADIIPDRMVGNAESADLNAITGWLGFYTYCKTLRPEYAQIIDDIFTKVGYKVNRVKVPNISSRPYWNFVKTVDANIIGSIPADHLTKIRNIFNNGVTFWKNGNNIGNYSLDNRPQSEV